MCVCSSVWVCCVCMFACMCAYVCLFVCACARMCVCTCMCVVYACVCARVCMCQPVRSPVSGPPAVSNQRQHSSFLAQKAHKSHLWQMMYKPICDKWYISVTNDIQIPSVTNDIQTKRGSGIKSDIHACVWLSDLRLKVLTRLISDLPPWQMTWTDTANIHLQATDTFHLWQVICGK